MNFEPSAKAQDFVKRVRAFMKNEIAPLEAAYWDKIEAQCNGREWVNWRIPPEMEALKSKAREAGLWNMFLPDEKLGAGLSTMEYALIAEETGRSLMAPEVFNCNAPDTGNMEVLWKYGNAEQKKEWLEPLLAGEIRSVFCMTEPDVASSDATNMQATATLEGDEVVINGTKWWSSGIGDPRAKIAIVMARTENPDLDRHHQHTMVLVPLNTPGVSIKRMLPVFGTYDEPHGHGEVEFNNVRVPQGNVIAGLGKGFEIAQGRLEALLNFQNKQRESILYIYEKQTGSKYNFNQAEYQKRVNMILSHGENSNSGHMLAVGASENRLNTLLLMQLFASFCIFLL